MGSDADRLQTIWADAWKTPDRRPPWAWAEEYIASIPYSPTPGRFRSDNSPWIREPMECAVDPAYKFITIVAGIQASKTLMMEILTAYIIDNMPGPMLWLAQTDADAKEEMKARLQKLYEACPPLAETLSSMDRHAIKLDAIHWPTMSQFVKGGNNLTNLQSKSIRWLFGDETWTWPRGHMAHAEGRITSFGWLAKAIFASQAGDKDDDMDRKFQASDQREWHFRCPECGTFHPYEWKQIEWSPDSKRDDGSYDMSVVEDSIRHVCPNCSTRLRDTERNRRLKNNAGKYIPMNPGAIPSNAGFHWNSLCANPLSYLAGIYLDAKTAAGRGLVEDLKSFYMKRLAMPWDDEYEDFKMEIVESDYDKEELWEKEGVWHRSGVPAEMPPPLDPGAGELEENRRRAFLRGSVPLRTLTVDVQLDHFWAVVRSWSPTGDSRLIYCGGGSAEMAEKDPSKESLLTWSDIETLQERFGVSDSMVFIDAGYNTSEVYASCALHGWTALMGTGRPGFPHKIADGNGLKRGVERYYSQVKRVKVTGNKPCRLHYFSNLNAKDTLNALRSNQDPEAGATWEVYPGVPEWYLKQMDSEVREKKGNTWVWSQVGGRANHIWDVEVQAVVAAYMLKLVGRESAKVLTFED